MILPSSNVKQWESFKFHLILRLRNRYDPDCDWNTAADTQQCAEVSTQLIFSHGYYHVNQADTPASAPTCIITKAV